MYSIWGKAMAVLTAIAGNSDLSRYVDFNLGIPHIYRGSGDIKLIVMGQDPTVKNKTARATIKTVLNLDKEGNLRSYIIRICNELGLSFEQNIYATNYLKNFFIRPPTQFTTIDVFEAFSPYWLPLLREEIEEFPKVPVITLGGPLLSAIVCGDASPRVRDYWGYTPNWQSSVRGDFKYLEPANNILNRVIFPLPHQPSLGKQFYSGQLSDYMAFVNNQIIIGYQGSTG